MMTDYYNHKAQVEKIGKPKAIIKVKRRGMTDLFEEMDLLMDGKLSKEMSFRIYYDIPEGEEHIIYDGFVKRIDNHFMNTGFKNYIAIGRGTKDVRLNRLVYNKNELQNGIDYVYEFECERLEPEDRPTDFSSIKEV